MIRRDWTIVLVSLLVTALWVPTAWAQSDEDSAYSRLDRQRLMERLNALGMQELTEALLAGQTDSDTAEGQLRTVDLQITRATGRGVPLAERNRLLDDALAQYGEIIKDLPADEWKDRLARYGRTFDWAWRTVSLRGWPYTDRLVNLQGGEADRKEVLAVTEKPVQTMEYLIQDIKDDIRELRGGGISSRVFIRTVPAMEELQLKAKFHSAITYFYRGMALAPDGPDAVVRKRLLEDAINTVAQFADAPDDEWGVRFDSILLTGRALRALGKHQAALERLRQVSGAKNAMTKLRVQALFEQIRTIAETGNYPEAAIQLEGFRTQGEALVGTAGMLDIDLMAAMLGYYIFDRWAATDEAKKDSLTRSAQEALVGFWAKHREPGVPRAYYRIVAAKFRDREDDPELSSFALLSMTSKKWDDAAATLDMTRRRELLGEALEFAKRGQSKGDGLPGVDAELAKWNAKIERLIGDPRVAARSALDQVKKQEKANPEGPDLPRDAETAILLAYDIIYGLESSGQPVPRSDRALFIDAASFLLSHEAWLAEAPALQRWLYDLGWNYSVLAADSAEDEQRSFYEQAVDTYELVPETLDGDDNTRQYMESNYNALGLRLLILSEDEDPSGDKAQDLRTRLKTYGNKAKTESDQAAAEGKAELKTMLDGWGSEMEFAAAELLYDPLGNAGAAVTELAGLGQRWQGTSVLENSAELEIRIEVDRGNTTEAKRKLDQFRAKYPDKAQNLVRLLVAEIRSRIAEYREDAAMAAQLGELQKNYNALAKMLYDPAKPLDQRYRETQMYAESLYEVGQCEDALALFEECKAVGDAEREKRKAELDKVFEQWQENVKAAAEPDAIKALAEKMLKRLADAGYGKDSRYVEEINSALNELSMAGEDASKRKAAAQIVARNIRNTARGLRDVNLAKTPIDPTNVYGIARCQIELGQFDAGLLNYAQLFSQTDRNNPKLAKLYWQYRLEHARAALRSYDEDASGLKKLVGMIRQLKFETQGALGGLAAKFEEIEQKALARMAAMGQPWQNAPAGGND